MRSKHKKWYRRIRTTAEHRANQDCKYARAKRRGHNLPNAWDDIPITTSKNWKDHRKIQYHLGGRGKRHELEFDAWDDNEDRLVNYLEKHDIPHTVEYKYTNHKRTRITYKKYVEYAKVPIYRNVFNRETRKFEVDYSHQVGYRSLFDEILLDKPIIKTYTYSERIGTKVVWWSDKDIGLNFILKGK